MIMMNIDMTVEEERRRKRDRDFIRHVEKFAGSKPFTPKF